MNHHRLVGRATRSLTRLTAAVLAATTALVLLPRDAVAECATSASVMTCTVTTTNDTVDTTGFPANAASLRDAIIQVNSVAPPPSGQTHIINLPANFVGTSFKVTLFKFLPPIWNDVTINGNGNTIEGNNVAITGTGFDTRLFIVGSNGDATGQPYFAPGARVKFALNDLTLKNGVARGGSGGGGGMGAGGAIFVTANGDVIARSVHFLSNRAIGGDGISDDAYWQGGGGMGGSGSDLGGAGGWGGSGRVGGGGLAGDGGGLSTDVTSLGSGGGGMSRAIVGATTSLRGAAVAAAGGGVYLSTLVTPGAPSGGGGHGGSAVGKSGNAEGDGGTSHVAGSVKVSVGGGGGGVGGAPATDTFASSSFNPAGGNGGFGGGGGASYCRTDNVNLHTCFGDVHFSSDSGPGGAGGFGGGGASTYRYFGPAPGGFGGGGGSSRQGGDGASAGGFAAGASGPAFGDSGGGAGLGGAVFVHQGGTFQVRGETGFATNSAQGGSGGVNGKGCADGIFVHGNQPVVLAPQSNETVTIEDEIADNDCAGTVSPVGAGGIDKTGAGSVNFVAAMKVSRDVNITAGAFRLMSSSLSSVPRLIVDGSTTRFETNGGAVFGDIVVRNSATLFPGFVLPSALPIPARIVNANVTFATSGARYEVYLAGTSAGSGHSQLVLPDTAVVNVALTQLVIKLKPGYVPALGDVFRIIDYGNASFSGNFVGLPANATTIVNGITFQITYNGGFVRLEVTAVPVATPVIALSSNLNPSTTAQSFQLTATVSGSNGTPTGNVQFFDADAPIVGCEARALSAGQASCIVTLTAAGAHAVTAVYLGGSAYGAATSPVLTQTVTKSSVTVGVTTSVNPAAVNAPVVLTATVSRTAATGGVTFRADGVAIAGCGSGSHPTVNGVSYCNTSFATAGSRSISASFVGDANYHAASSSALTLQVGFVPGAPSLQGVTPAAPSAIGQATLAFLPPADDGGSAITSYTARCINVTTSQVVSVTQATSPIVVSPLFVGMAYSCTVVASNVLGDSAPSSSATITAFASLNIDASTANGSIYDAATDGVMILRYMLGVRGDAISAGVIGATATRDAAQIAAYLDNIKSQLDIDGDGSSSAATDGLLIMRHMRGLATVTSAYILNAFNPAGSRNNEDDITTYLSQMMP